MFSVCVYVWIYVCISSMFSLEWPIHRGIALKKSLPVIDSCTQTVGIMGDQWGLSHLLSLTLEFTLLGFFHMPLSWMLTVSFSSQLCCQIQRLFFKDVFQCSKMVRHKKRYLMLSTSKNWCSALLLKTCFRIYYQIISSWWNQKFNSYRCFLPDILQFLFRNFWNKIEQKI